MAHTKVEIIGKYPPCSFKSEGGCRDDGEAHYDGRTIHGPWAMMCEQHFSAYGVGLGLGRGQELILKGKLDVTMDTQHLPTLLEEEGA